MIESLGKWQATQVSHSLMNLPSYLALAIISLVKGKAVIAYKKSKYIHQKFSSFRNKTITKNQELNQ